VTVTRLDVLAWRPLLSMTINVTVYVPACP
jgi:hypothetical protein